MIRSVVRGVGSALPTPHHEECRFRRHGRDLGRVDRPAHRHSPAPYRRRRRDDGLARRGGGARSARQCRPDARRHRPDRARDLDAQQHLSRPPPSRSSTGSACITASPSTCRRCARASSMRSTTPTSISAGGMAKRVLVIGAETFSRILDWTDRSTCVLFGDGAGAMVLEAGEGEGTHRRPRRAGGQPALRRRPQGQALCRRRAVDDRHGRPAAHGRPRGLQARRRHDHRRRRSDVSPRPASPPATSTGSCRTRPTSASSTLRPRSSASPRKRW